jgi:hypothetical protein
MNGSKVIRKMAICDGFIGNIVEMGGMWFQGGVIFCTCCGGVEKGVEAWIDLVYVA